MATTVTVPLLQGLVDLAAKSLEPEGAPTSTEQEPTLGVPPFATAEISCLISLSFDGADFVPSSAE